MRRERSLDGDYFEALYRDKGDPWGFATRDYEAAKYAHTLAALGDERATRALEMGCSIGVFTRQLAARCDELVATEVSATALNEARRRCADRSNIDFRLAHGVTDGMDGAFDLMVLSEIVYYWDDKDLGAVALAIRRTLSPGGRLLLVHWLGETDYPRSGDDAVGALAAGLDGLMEVEQACRTAEYRLDLWRRCGAQAASAVAAG
jgi:SAM-dependent methyltransferase